MPVRESVFWISCGVPAKRFSLIAIVREQNGVNPFGIRIIAMAKSTDQKRHSPGICDASEISPSSEHRIRRDGLIENGSRIVATWQDALNST